MSFLESSAQLALCLAGYGYPSSLYGMPNQLQIIQILFFISIEFCL